MMQVEEEDFPPLALDLDDDSPLGFGEIDQSMVANSDERRSSTLRRENNRGTAGEVSRVGNNGNVSSITNIAASSTSQNSGRMSNDNACSDSLSGVIIKQVLKDNNLKLVWIHPDQRNGVEWVEFEVTENSLIPLNWPSVKIMPRDGQLNADATKRLRCLAANMNDYVHRSRIPLTNEQAAAGIAKDQRGLHRLSVDIDQMQQYFYHFDDDNEQLIFFYQHSKLTPYQEAVFKLAYPNVYDGRVQYNRELKGLVFSIYGSEFTLTTTPKGTLYNGKKNGKPFQIYVILFNGEIRYKDKTWKS